MGTRLFTRFFDEWRGKLSAVFGENQFVKAGDPVLSILPKDKEALVGRMQVPAVNSGKIIKGEKVLIKLDNYRFRNTAL